MERIRGFVRRFGSNDLSELLRLSYKEYFISIQDRNYNLNTIEFLWKYGLYSYDPRDPINLRWGSDPEAVSTLITRRMNKTLSEREKLIEIQFQNKKCTEENQCEAGDLDWLNYNTYKLDKNFFDIAEAVARYSNIFSSKDFDELVVRLNKNFSELHGQDLSFFHFLDFLPFLNSDPRVSFDQRWGKDRQKYYYYRFPSDITSLQISSNAVALINSNKIIDLKKGKEIKLPDNMGPLSQEPSTGITVGIQQDEEEYLIVYHPQASVLEKIKLDLGHEGESYEIIWHSDSVFSLYRFPELQIYKLDFKFSSSTTLLTQFSNILQMTRVVDLPAEKKHKTEIMFSLRNDQNHKYLLSANMDKAFIQELFVDLNGLAEYVALGTFKEYIVLSKITPENGDSNCSVFIDKNTGGVLRPFEKNKCVQNVWDDLNTIATEGYNNKWDLLVLNNNLEIIRSESLSNVISLYKNNDNLYIHSMDYNPWENHSFKYSKSDLVEFTFPNKTIMDGQGPLLRLVTTDEITSLIYNMLTDEMIVVPYSKISSFSPTIPTWSYYFVRGMSYFYGSSFEYLGIELFCINQEQGDFKNSIVKFDSITQNQQVLLPIMTTPSMWNDDTFTSFSYFDINIRNGYLLKMTSQGNWFWFSEK